MKNCSKTLSAIAILTILISGCSQKVTVSSLLEEMTDRTELTYFPEQDFMLKQFSSYNRKTVAKDEAGWWENSDMSHFIRVEQNEGRREFVMFDHEGPGAIVRWWMTFWRAEDGILRIYLDHDSIPEIEGAPFDVISGQFLAQKPFSEALPPDGPINERGHNLYLPIPYAEHCKVTYEVDTLEVKEHYFWPDVFYNINYREYTGDVEVETFTMEALEEIQNEIDLAEQLLMEDFSSDKIEENFNQELLPGDSIVLTFNNKKKAIDFLSLELDGDYSQQALRSIVLSMEFDGNKTVWVPVGEFFGTGYKMLSHKTWANQSDSTGGMSSAWIMPFQENCKVTYTNYGDVAIKLKGEIGLCDYTWKDNSLYFGACWHEYYHIKTRSQAGWMFDMNYADIEGKGLWVGDQVSLFNMAKTWWGEGDEKIFVDGEEFPSHIGTGSEDYYGYAFARPEAFSHPFMCQPSGAGNWVPDLTVNIRHRSLDVIPFNSSISTNIEMWHWADCCMNYALTSYYYVSDPFEINIKQDIAAVRKSIATSEKDFYASDTTCLTIEDFR